MTRWIILFWLLFALPVSADEKLSKDCAETSAPERQLEICARLLTAVTSADQAMRTRAHHYRGRAYYRLKLYGSALQEFSTAIKLSPQDAISYDRRGVVYRKVGQPDKAIADHLQAIVYNPMLAPAYRNLGNAYMFKGEVKRAVSQYSRAISIDPTYANAFDNRGAAYEQLASSTAPSTTMPN